MTSRVLNFLWLNLDLPALPDPEDGSIRQPLPTKYIENVRRAGGAHPETQIVLWVDSKRLTERQYAFLQGAIEADRPNVHLKDLRGLPAYDKEQLYNQAETNPNWRECGQKSLIWRQVDAAKVLISLQGKFDQSFFADLDHAHLDVDSPKVQRMLDKRGVMIGSSSVISTSIENQVWGFTGKRRGFFEEYYLTALKCAYEGKNAWYDLVTKVGKDLERKKGIGRAEICLPIGGDGTSAEQPGHQWRKGEGDAAGGPAMVAKGQLTAVFNERSKAVRRPCPNIDVVWTPAPGTTPRPPGSGFFGRLRSVLKMSVGA